MNGYETGRAAARAASDHKARMAKALVRGMLMRKVGLTVAAGGAAAYMGHKIASGNKRRLDDLSERLGRSGR